MGRPAIFKEFQMEDIFNIVKGKRLTKQDQRSGETLFIGATAENHGETARIGQAPLFPGNTITVSYNGSVGEAFYQEEPYWASDDINVLSLKNHELNKNIAIYLCAVIRKAGKLFYYNQKWNLERMKATSISLPVNADSMPDWAYMEQYIAEIEEERMAELDAYLTACGFNDYELTNEENDVINASPEWKEFKIIDIFAVHNTHSILKEWVTFNSGDIPYVTAGEGNNSIASYVDCNNAEWIETGKCILIGGKTTVITYQDQDFVSNDSHNLALYAKSEKANEYIYRFMVSAMQKSLRQKYSWGDSISKKKIQNDYFKLPVLPDGTPDFEYMEKYIKAIEKLTIKDVVEWKDKGIAATKAVLA